ncbi:MAG TPA: YihY/virulence factor BrkB family protein [Terriglobia bacterium]|nr:YihY/virulence factor BrkB family protein [Terriglobia bacterium]
MSKKARRKNPSKLAGRWRRIRQVLGDSLVNFINEDSLMVSASIAYHSLLCIFPFLLLLIGLSGIYIKHLELAGRLAVVLDRALPMKPDFILQNLQSISRSYGPISVISILLLLWSSSGIFLPLEKALNRAWDIEVERSWWRKRVLALEMAVILGFLILISSALVGVNVYIHNWLRQKVLDLPAALIDLSYYALIVAITFGMTFAMFLLLFERLPNARLRFHQVFPSALVTAVFWEAARSLFTLLLPRFNYRHVYGPIALFVALMTWAYISSAVVLFGAQVSRSLYGTLEANSDSEE